MKSRQTRKEKKIRGWIIPAQTDQKGDIIAIALRTDNKKEYVVEKNKIGMELYPLVDNEIWAEGTFRERIDGKVIMKIINYQKVSEKGPL